MFRRFRNGSSDAHNWLVEQFRKRRSEIESAADQRKIAFALASANYWKAFVSAFESPARFSRLPSDQQMAYFRTLAQLRAGMIAQKDFANAAPLEVFAIYLSSIIGGAKSFEREIDDFLDQYIRREDLDMTGS